jgi:hypothetical protein
MGNLCDNAPVEPELRRGADAGGVRVQGGKGGHGGGPGPGGQGRGG